MKQRNENAKRNWDVALEDWNKKCGDAQFQTELQRLQAVRRELADLPNERTKRLNLLQARRETNQRSAYLDRYRIDRAKIPLVGPTRVAMLASYGVETAADIEPAKIKNIPGFGTAITRHLLDWRAQHERNFRFNPNEAVDPREIANVERDVQLKQINLIQDLKSGAQRLSHFRAEAISARERLKPIVERAWREKEWLAKAMS